MMKPAIIFLLWCIGNTNLSSAQLTMTVQLEKDINHYMVYNWQPFEIIYDKPGVNDTLFTVADTFNVCRIRQSKLKRLYIYKISDQVDSTLIRTVEYNRSGQIDTVLPGIGWLRHSVKLFEPVEIDCEDYLSGYKLNYPQYHSKTIIYKEKKEKIQSIYAYDSLGYLVERMEKDSRKENRFNYHKISNYKYKYVYLDEYRIMRIYGRNEKGVDIEKAPYDMNTYLEYATDENHNLLREVYITLDDAGKKVKYWGYSYKYEYYE